MAMDLSHAFETRYRQRSLQAVQFMRTKASGHPSWPGVSDSTQGRIHWRRPTAIARFSLATLRRTMHDGKTALPECGFLPVPGSIFLSQVMLPGWDCDIYELDRKTT